MLTVLHKFDFDTFATFGLRTECASLSIYMYYKMVASPSGKSNCLVPQRLTCSPVHIYTKLAQVCSTLSRSMYIVQLCTLSAKL